MSIALPHTLIYEIKYEEIADNLETLALHLDEGYATTDEILVHLLRMAAQLARLK